MFVVKSRTLSTSRDSTFCYDSNREQTSTWYYATKVQEPHYPPSDQIGKLIRLQYVDVAYRQHQTDILVRGAR